MNKKILIGIIIIILIVIVCVGVAIVINTKEDSSNTTANITENNQELSISNKIEPEIDSDIHYKYEYGEIFKIDNNIIYFGDVVEESTNYLSLEISEKYKVIDFETEEIISINDIEVGDYANFHTLTEENENAQSIIIVAKKDYIVDEIENELLNKTIFSAELIYYNEEEKYITIKLGLDHKAIDNVEANAVYYFNLMVDDTTETYLGYSNNLNSYRYCTVEIELKSEITNLQNEYLVKSIAYIPD